MMFAVMRICAWPCICNLLNVWRWDRAGFPAHAFFTLKTLGYV